MPSSPLSATIRTALIGTAICISISACASFSDTDTHIGVLPPPPPKPLWLGAITPPVDSALRGSAAVAPSGIPQWSHVLVSIAGARPAAAYSWALHSGGCSDNGPVVGPATRYGPLIAFADGTAAAESVIPAVLTTSATYSVSITPGASAGSGTPVACANLAYGGM